MLFSTALYQCAAHTPSVSRRPGAQLSIVSVYDSTAESSLKVRLVYQLDVIKGHQASILSPLGTALLGSRAGEEVKFKVREGGTKLIKIETIIFQPEANGEYDI